jgi:hypothetical protein
MTPAQFLEELDKRIAWMPEWGLSLGIIWDLPLKYFIDHPFQNCRASVPRSCPNRPQGRARIGNRSWRAARVDAAPEQMLFKLNQLIKRLTKTAYSPTGQPGLTRPFRSHAPR